MSKGRFLDKSVTLRELLAVLTVVSVVATCVWAVVQRESLHAAFSARSQWLSRSNAPVTGIRDLDAALRQPWMFAGGRGRFPYDDKGGQGKAGKPPLGDMGSEELRRAMGLSEKGGAPSGSARQSAAGAGLAEHCYSLHKPMLCPRETKPSGRTTPDGSACTNPGQDHVGTCVGNGGLASDSSLSWPHGPNSPGS